MRAEPRRLLAGDGRVAQHRGGVAGGLGVVGEPGRVGAARVEPLEHLAVQRRAPPRRDLGLEREPRELVAERDGAAVEPRHAREQALVERLVGGVDQLGSAAPGIMARRSSSSRAGGLRRAARASTASRTVAGIAAAGADSTSVT